MSERRSYDVRREPWIQAVTLDGDVTDLSLLEVLDRAPELRRLTGEIATQQVAVLRLLLAVLLRAIPVEREAVEVWGELWRRGRFDSATIELYLEAHADRFDLLDEECPFLQVAGLHNAKGEMTSLARLVTDVPAGAQYLTTRTAASYDALPLAEATRWLVHAHAFDSSGIKSGAVGDERVKGGKGYPIGTGWCGAIGPVVLEGATLFETLLLNLPLRWSSRRDLPDLPVWEREPLGPGPEQGHPEPTGVADQLTWPSRRIRLAHDDSRVTGVLLCNGDKLHAGNRSATEPMTAWRRSEAQEKALGIPEVFMPRKHYSDRAVWRGLGGLLALTPVGSAHQQGYVPGVVEWLASLREAGELDAGHVVRVRVSGLVFGSKDSTVEDLVDDGLEVAAAVLSDGRLGQLAVDAVGDVDRSVLALADLARNLVLAAGGDPEGERERARETGYALVDPYYRRWVRTLGPDTDAQQVRVQWQKALSLLFGRLGADLVGRAGPPARRGREVVSGRGTAVEVNSALAEIWFRAALRKALVLAQDPADDGGHR